MDATIKNKSSAPPNVRASKPNDENNASNNRKTGSATVNSTQSVQPTQQLKTTKFLVSLGENDLKASLAKRTTTERLLKPNALSDLFGNLKKPPKLLNLLGDELQDDSAKSCIDVAEKVSTDQDPLSKYSHLLEEAYKNLNDPIDPTPNKVLHSMILGLNKVNTHHMGSKFVNNVEQRLKHVSASRNVILPHKSLSDRFTLSNKHNMSLSYNHWKMMGIMDSSNNLNSTNKNSTGTHLSFYSILNSFLILSIFHFLVTQRTSSVTGSANTNSSAISHTLNGNTAHTGMVDSILNGLPKMSSASSANNLNLFDEPFEFDKELLNSICFGVEGFGDVDAVFPQVLDEVDTNNNINANNHNKMKEAEKPLLGSGLLPTSQQTIQAELKETDFKPIQRSTSSSYDLNNLSMSSYNMVQVKSNSNLIVEDSRYGFHIRKLTNLVLKILSQVKKKF
jgi:hypothetical protein